MLHGRFSMHIGLLRGVAKHVHERRGETVGAVHAGPVSSGVPVQRALRSH